MECVELLTDFLDHIEADGDPHDGTSLIATGLCALGRGWCKSFCSFPFRSSVHATSSTAFQTLVTSRRVRTSKVSTHVSTRLSTHVSTRVSTHVSTHGIFGHVWQGIICLALAMGNTRAPTHGTLMGAVGAVRRWLWHDATICGVGGRAHAGGRDTLTLLPRFSAHLKRLLRDELGGVPVTKLHETGTLHLRLS